MKTSQFRNPALLAVVLALAVTAQTAHAQITSIVSSDVQGYFGSLSDAFQQAEGPTIPPWAASGPGFYPVTGPANVPPLYPTFPNPVLPVTSNIPWPPSKNCAPPGLLPPALSPMAWRQPLPAFA